MYRHQKISSQYSTLTDARRYNLISELVLLTWKAAIGCSKSLFHTNCITLILIKSSDRHRTGNPQTAVNATVTGIFVFVWWVQIQKFRHVKICIVMYFPQLEYLWPAPSSSRSGIICHKNDRPGVIPILIGCTAPSLLRNYRHQLHQKLSFWKAIVQHVTKMSSNAGCELTIGVEELFHICKSFSIFHWPETKLALDWKQTDHTQSQHGQNSLGPIELAW